MSWQASSVMWILATSASTVMPANITTAVMPMVDIVEAAFFDFGARKAGTPLEIASTPVSAVQPEAKARRPSISRPSPARVSLWSAATIPYEALEETGAWPNASLTNPVMIISRMPPMNRYVGAAKALPDSRTPRRFIAARITTKPTAIATR